MATTAPLPPFTVVSNLVSRLGDNLVAYLAGEGVSLSQVERWAGGFEIPAQTEMIRMGAALEMFDLIAREEDADTARAFFICPLSELGNRTPADALRAGEVALTQVSAVAAASNSLLASA